MLQSTYAGYETGTRKIPLSVIVQLSKFFGVEADVLIGLSDYVPPKQSTFDLKESEKNLIITYRKLKSRRKNRNFVNVLQVPETMKAKILYELRQQETPFKREKPRT